MDKKELIDIISSFRYRVRVVACYHKLNDSYTNECLSCNSRIKLSPVFWGITSRAYIHAMMNDLCKLYEYNKSPDQPVYGIQYLLDVCEKNCQFFSTKPLPYGDRYFSQEEVKEFFTAFGEKYEPDDSVNLLASGKDFIGKLKSYLRDDELKLKIEKLKKQRNKIWAHNDCKNFLNPGNYEKQECLLDTDIDYMIKSLDQITAALLSRLGKNVSQILPEGIDDIKFVLKD